MPPRFLCEVISIFSIKIWYCKICKKYLSNNNYFRHSLNQGQISLGLVTGVKYNNQNIHIKINFTYNVITYIIIIMARVPIQIDIH